MSTIRSVLLSAVLGMALELAPPALAQTIASKVDYVGTSRYLTVSGLKAREVNGLLNLYVEITNSDNDDQEGYYRIDWVDDAGFPAWEEEAWKPIVLHGNQKRTLQIIAPSRKAQDFKIVFSGERNWSGPTGPRE